jgi:hypothetical protein
MEEKWRRKENCYRLKQTRDISTKFDSDLNKPAVKSHLEILKRKKAKQTNKQKHTEETKHGLRIS